MAALEGFAADLAHMRSLRTAASGPLIAGGRTEPTRRSLDLEKPFMDEVRPPAMGALELMIDATLGGNDIASVRFIGGPVTIRPTVRLAFGTHAFFPWVRPTLKRARTS